MWSLLLFAALSFAPSGPATLESLAAALRSVPAWHAAFDQRYLPAGFDKGTEERGSVLLASPLRIRFEYATGHRVFAVDGNVVRFVDGEAGTCDATALDRTTWGRLPLAALLDPGATQRAFRVEGDGRTIRLVPKDPMPEIAEIEVTVDRDGLPASVTVRDASGNRNELTFTSWRKASDPGDGPFRPALPGAPPCAPAGG